MAIEQLVVVANLKRLPRPVDFTFRQVDGVGLNHFANVLERKPESGNLSRIDLKADRARLFTLDGDLADAFKSGQLRDKRLRRVFGYRVKGHRVGGERQGDDRHVGRVHLMIRRRRRKQVHRQPTGRGVYGRLHVLRRRRDVTRQAELKGDLTCAV